MRILHRHLILELILNAVLFLVVVLAIYFVMSLALLMGRSAAETLPVLVVLRVTGFEVLSNLNLILPLTLLSAAVFTYGRANSEGEVTAIRVAGIHPYQVLVPALFMGGLGTVALAWVQDELVPKAHFKRRVEFKQDILNNLEELLKGRSRDISERRWSARWNAVAQDQEGNLVLLNLLLIRKNAKGTLESRLMAKRAWPEYMQRENRLGLILEDGRMWGRTSQPQVFKRIHFDLDLDALAGRRRAAKRDDDLSYEELLTGSQQMDDRARLFVGNPERRRWARKRSRELRTVYHYRVAFAFSALLFSFLGASLGLFRPVGNRAIVFLIAFLLVVLIYYPLQQLGMRLGRDGRLPPSLALWIGNGALLLISSALFKKVLRV